MQKSNKHDTSHISIRHTLMNALEHCALSLFYLVLFIAPLKFGIPYVAGMGSVLPTGLVQGLFFSWPYEIGEQLIIATVLLLVVRLLLSRSQDDTYLPWNWVSTVMVLFLVWLFIVYPFAMNSYAHRSGLRQFVSFGLIYIVAQMLLGRNRSRVFVALALLVLGGTLTAFYGIYQYFSGLEQTQEWAALYLTDTPMIKEILGRLNQYRVFATFVYPNAFAGYLVLVVPLSVVFFSLWCARRLRDKVVLSVIGASVVLIQFFCFLMNVSWVWYLAGIFGSLVFPLSQFVALLLTFSKTAYLIVAAYIVGWGACLVMTNYLRRRSAVMVLAGLFLVAWVGIACYFPHGFVAKGKRSFSARLGYWRAARLTLKKQPLWGSGFGSFGIKYSHYKRPFDEETQMVHNNYLQMAVVAGVPGMVLFSLIWILGMWYAIRTVRVSKQSSASLLPVALAMSLFGVVVSGFFDFALFVPGIGLLSYVILAMITVLDKRMYRISFHSAFAKMVLVGVLILGIWECWQTSRQLASQVYYHRAQQCLSKRLYRDALKWAHEALTVAPDNPVNHLLAGDVFFNTKEFRKAYQAYERAVTCSPEVGIFYLKIALTHARIYDIRQPAVAKKIEQLLHTSLGYHPNKSDLLFSVGTFYEEQGQVSKAMHFYRRSFICDPGKQEYRKKVVARLKQLFYRR